MNKRRLEAARIAASPIYCRGPSRDYVLRGKSNAIKVDAKLRSSAVAHCWEFSYRNIGIFAPKHHLWKGNARWAISQLPVDGKVLPKPNAKHFHRESLL